MSDSFQGVLEGKDVSGSNLRIVLNANTGDITAGGNGRGGDVALRNDENQTTIMLNAAGDEGLMPLGGGASPQPVVAINGLGSITVGEPGTKKAVTLRALKKSGTERTGELLLGDGSGNTIVLQAVDGGNAVIRVGGGKKTGWIALYNADGKEAVLLGGPAGLLHLRDDAGATLLSLQATDGEHAMIRVGGTKTGWAAFYSAKGKETAVLGGDPGLLQLRDANGTTMIELKAQSGAGRFGGRGVDGDVLVFGKDAPNQDADEASVWIQGGKGDIILRNADCAEEFEVADGNDVEPGAVLALTRGGQLRLADHPYDCRVAGVISGAGGLRPGIVLGRVPGGQNRWPIALSGKVFCKADASYAPIEAGDLLTTSATPGHAMVAREPSRSFGAVLGKAVGPLASGTGMIPILVALQ